MRVSSVNSLRRKAGLILAPVVAAFIYLLPLDLNTDARAVFSIMGFCLVFWLTEVIPLSMTALLGVSIAVVLGITDVKEAFLSLGHPVILLFYWQFSDSPVNDQARS
ncbi:MAG: hypothetical protein Q9M89_07800 [Persephonella sp.]|nr:hypothetical protein [Persephonella sp.]